MKFKHFPVKYDFILPYCGTALIISAGYSYLTTDMVIGVLINPLLDFSDSIKDPIFEIFKKTNPKLSKIKDVYDLLD